MGNHANRKSPTLNQQVQGSSPCAPTSLRSLREPRLGKPDRIFAAKRAKADVAHTSKHAPWVIKTYLAFSDEKQAFAFEKYLKSASGRAFAKKRL
jgi:hypothetical protein